LSKDFVSGREEKEKEKEKKANDLSSPPFSPLRLMRIKDEVFWGGGGGVFYSVLQTGLLIKRNEKDV